MTDSSRKSASTLLIYAPVPLFQHEDRLFVERQACNGLRLWAANFSHVDAMMPIEHGEPPAEWVPVEDFETDLDRVTLHPLPTAYRPDQFLRHYWPTRKRIARLIAKSDYLSFAIGGLFGDWGAVACLQAYRMRRRFAVWTDRVESRVILAEQQRGTRRHRLRARLYHRPMAALERHVIRRANLGLFHGRDTFEAYAPYCSNPVLVHDIHINKSDHIGADALRQKTDECANGPLRLVYAGRVDAMKGPLDWVAVLAELNSRGIDFRATWFGDGDMLSEMTSAVAAAGLEDRVDLPGFTTDRSALLNALRTAHVFLFCHKTPESPRCLIEALISGCPIVGYDAAFQADLIAEHQGGVLTERDNVSALSDAVAALATNRNRLADLIARAAKDGAPFEAQKVFRHRSDVIKANLGPN